MRLAELTQDNITLYAGRAIEQILLISDIHERAERFTDVMNKAREFGVADAVKKMSKETAEDYNEPELWELPEPFEKSVPLQSFPLSSLPPVLGEYLKAVSENVQVYPEMCVLPLLSVLSLCVQGKYEVQFPNSQHTEPLNLYTVTVAKPGERKSGVFRAFTAPLWDYQKAENERRQPLISEYRAQKKFLENQLDKATKGNNANPQRAKELSQELDELKPVHRLTLNVTDCTPEALTAEMSKNNECMGILDDECGLFDQLAGLYSGGISNIDIFLKSYDRAPYTVIRRTKDNLYLEKPVLTLGLMAQSEPFEKAMHNSQFVGRGLIQRFLFAFPESRQGERKQSSPPVPESAKNAYTELVTKLLSLKSADKPYILRFNRQASLYMSDYFDNIEQGLKPEGRLEFMAEWANKLYAKCVRIAGILHLCQHSHDEPIDEQTAQRAVNVAMWAENHAYKAFSGGVSDTQEVKDAKYILSRIKTTGKAILTRREIKRLCKAIKDDIDFDEPLATLEEQNFLRKFIENTKGRSSERYEINPLVYKC